MFQCPFTSLHLRWHCILTSLQVTTLLFFLFLGFGRCRVCTWSKCYMEYQILMYFGKFTLPLCQLSGPSSSTIFFSPFLVGNYGCGREGGLGISSWEEHTKIPRRQTRYVSKQAKYATCVLNHPCFCRNTLCTLFCFLWWGRAFCNNTDTRPLGSLQLQHSRSSFVCRQAQYWMPVPPFRAPSSAKKYYFVFLSLSLSLSLSHTHTHTHKFQPFFYWRNIMDMKRHMLICLSCLTMADFHFG
jgi:hypothetical protein